MCENWHYKKLADRIRKESIDGMKHAEALIEPILFPDGIPNMTEPMQQDVQPVRSTGAGKIKETGYESYLSQRIREEG